MVDEGFQDLELARLAAEFRQYRIPRSLVRIWSWYCCAMDTLTCRRLHGVFVAELVKREVFRLEFQRQQADLQHVVQFDGTCWLVAGVKRIHIHNAGFLWLGMGSA